MSGYTKTGPFVSGGAPGIDYVFLNNVETYLAYAADSAITTNGSGVLTMSGLVVNGNATINGSITSTGGSITVSSIVVSGNCSVTGIVSTNQLTLKDGSHISTFHNFAGSGSGTVSTSCPSTPNGMSFNPCTLGSSSQTIGGTMAVNGSVTTGAGFAWNGTAYNF